MFDYLRASLVGLSLAALAISPFVNPSTKTTGDVPWCKDGQTKGCRPVNGGTLDEKIADDCKTHFHFTDFKDYNPPNCGGPDSRHGSGTRFS